MISNNNFYSGFCFSNESKLFKNYIKKSDFSISGFSYGAQIAFEKALNSTTRVDLLQLFSPAFFQNTTEKYRRMQLMFFKKDTKAYCETFLKNVNFGSSKDIENYFTQGTYEQLETLLNYKWEKDKLEKLLSKGCKIEVYLGQKDKIIDSSSAYEFFKEFACVYFIKQAGHIL